MDDPKEGRDPKEGNGRWVSMPAFGDWDVTKNGPMPDYSMDFSKIREKRKQNRTTSRDSIGNDQELITRHHYRHSSSGNDHREPHRVVINHHCRHRSLGSNPKTTIINRRCGSIAEWIGSNRVVLQTRKKIKGYFNCFMVGA